MALAGFLIVNSGQFRVRSFPNRTSSVLPHLPMLEALDPKVDLIIFCDLVPIGELTAIPHYSSYNAMRLADLLRQMLKALTYHPSKWPSVLILS